MSPGQTVTYVFGSDKKNFGGERGIPLRDTHRAQDSVNSSRRPTGYDTRSDTAADTKRQDERCMRG
jgi:hypothetical protein